MNIAQTYTTGRDNTEVRWSGVVKLSAQDRDNVLRHTGMFIEGWDVDGCEEGLILLPKKNLVVEVGAARSLDRQFNVSGGTGVTPLNSLTQPVTRIGIDDGTTNPTADSISSNNGGGADTGSTNQTIRTFDTTASRVGLVISPGGTFNDPTTGGVGSVSFIMKRLFLTAHNANVTDTTSADADNTLYSMTNVFTIDFTSIDTWEASLTAQVTGIGA